MGKTQIFSSAFGAEKLVRMDVSVFDIESKEKALIEQLQVRKYCLFFFAGRIREPLGIPGQVR